MDVGGNAMITQWALKWNIPYDALTELETIFGLNGNLTVSTINGASEANVQARVRLEAARKGIKLWRNNVGVLLNERGTPVRYGLANDSPKLNQTIKSGDLIGWRPLTIMPQMVGSKIAQFISRECKEANWKYGASSHEQAQLKWIQLVCADGGDARFATGDDSL